MISSGITLDCVKIGWGFPSSIRKERPSVSCWMGTRAAFSRSNRNSAKDSPIAGIFLIGAIPVKRFRFQGLRKYDQSCFRLLDKVVRLNDEGMKILALLIAPHALISCLNAHTLVLVKTDFGDIPIRLFDDQTPHTVDHFLGYVERGDYQNTIFHRLITDFVLQTGGYTVTEPPQVSLLESVSAQPMVHHEPGISNIRGTIAMAKLGGDPDSTTSQWFINLADNSAILDQQNGGFTVFGEVLDMTTVDVIATQPVVNAGGSAFTTLPLTDAVDPIEREDFIRITNISVIPEPSTTGLLLLIAGFGFVRRR